MELKNYKKKSIKLVQTFSILANNYNLLKLKNFNALELHSQTNSHYFSMVFSFNFPQLKPDVRLFNFPLEKIVEKSTNPLQKLDLSKNMISN